MTWISQAFTVVVLLAFAAPSHGLDTSQINDGDKSVVGGYES